MIRELLYSVQYRFFPSEQQRELAKYYAGGGDYELRHKYDLTEDSLVLDLGGYKGQWTSDIFSVQFVLLFMYLSLWYRLLRVSRRGSHEIRR